MIFITVKETTESVAKPRVIPVTSHKAVKGV